MYFSTEETRPLVSIFTYIDAMLLNLEAPVPQQAKIKFVNLSVFKHGYFWSYLKDITEVLR
jgi:hypothetical protein